MSRRIGIKPNAVAALAYRARKGLREAYLQAHLKAEASEWSITRGSRSGRVAWQFIQDLAGRLGKPLA